MNVLQVGRYRVLQHLGGGGTSTVYLGEDTLLRRKVALKILRRHDADERNARHFQREARCAALLNHPNVVTIFDVGHEDEVHYIATEFVEGETLRQRIERGPMTFAEVVDVATAVANALVAAHEAWLVHRDIKPENIAIRKDGGVKVLDFGVAALSGDGDATDPIRRPGALVGTLPYLSPEQVRGEAIIDSRSDIYSLGVVMYEMLAGHAPFRGKDVVEVLAMIVEAEPPALPPLVPRALRDLVLACLRKNLYERPPTAADVVAALTQVRIDLLLERRSASA